MLFYFSNEYQGYFLESRLHFRIHAALHKLKKIEKERKRSKKLAKASKNSTISDHTLSDSDTDESDGFSNYDTASEGEEDSFQDAHTETVTRPSTTLNDFQDGASKVSIATSKNNNTTNANLGTEPKKSQNTSLSKKLLSKGKGPKLSLSPKFKKSPKQGRSTEPVVSQCSQQGSNGSQLPSVYLETSL